jgi:hypothetical protein
VFIFVGITKVQKKTFWADAPIQYNMTTQAKEVKSVSKPAVYCPDQHFKKHSILFQ